MKLTVQENQLIKLEEVFNPVVLEAASGEEMSVCMRDHGFEIEYGGWLYVLVKGEITTAPLP